MGNEPEAEPIERYKVYEPVENTTAYKLSFVYEKGFLRMTVMSNRVINVPIASWSGSQRYLEGNWQQLARAAMRGRFDSA
jgi:hypothetical protein